MLLVLTLAKAAAVDFGIQAVAWIASTLLKTEKLYDITGSVTFFLLTYQSVQCGQSCHLRQRLQTWMVYLYVLRLGLFLFWRMMKHGPDKRMDRAKNNPMLQLAFWTAQGMWIFFTVLPTLILNLKTDDVALGWRDFCGWSLWAIGMLIEVIADYQKARFRSDPRNQDAFIRHGLWRLSRHPNYFGDILLWSGLFISASSVMHGLEYFSIISPVFLAYLLINVSGIPLLERSATKQWGKTAEYQEYVRKTALLIPYIW